MFNVFVSNLILYDEVGLMQLLLSFVSATYTRKQ